MSAEPDQIDMMTESELRAGLRKLVARAPTVFQQRDDLLKVCEAVQESCDNGNGVGVDLLDMLDTAIANVKQPKAGPNGTNPEPDSRA